MTNEQHTATDCSNRPRLVHASVRAVIWKGAGQTVNQLFSMATMAVLARLIAPSAFGLLAMATIATNFLHMVANLGLGQALIQRDVVEERHLSTAFWSNAAVSLGLGILLVIVSPLVALFFDEPLLQPILAVLAAVAFLGSLGNVHSSMLQRDLNFKTITLIQTPATVGFGIVATTLALWSLEVWALVLGALARQLLQVVLLWLAYSWRPRLMFERKAFRELFGFGVNLTLTQFVVYAGNNVSNLLVGKYFGASSLAFYGLAWQLTIALASRVSLVLTSVTFPSFSRIQNEDAKIRAGHLAVSKYLASISYPMFVGMMITAPELIAVVYGPKWLSAIGMVQVLSIGAIFTPFLSLNSTMLKSIGRSDTTLKLSLGRNLTNIVFIVVGLSYGLIGISYADSVSRLIFYCAGAVVASSLIGLSMGTYLSALRPFFLSSGIMGLAVLSWKWIAVQLLGLTEVIVLTGCVSCGVIVYLSVLLMIGEKVHLEILRLVFESLPPAQRFRRWLFGDERRQY